MNKDSRYQQSELLKDWPRVLAHRGACTLAPENTLSAFKIAKDLGCKGYELDIHLCTSGELVVVHDHWMDRLAGCHKKIEDLSYDEIKELSVTKHFSEKFPDIKIEHEGTYIPTLDEVFELAGPDLFIDIEIKVKGSRHFKISQVLAETLAKHNRKNCIVSSFNPLALLDFKKHSDYPIAAIYCSDKSMPWYLRHGEALLISGAKILKPSVQMANAIKKIDPKKPVVVWTVDSIQDAQALFLKGVTTVITNRVQDFGQFI